MAEELKACPFCGGEPNLTHSDYVHDDLRPMPVVECKSCSAWVLAEDWNTRAQLPSQGGEAVEVVARIIESPSAIFPAVELTQSGVGIWGTHDLMTVAQHQRIMAASVSDPGAVAVDDLSAFIRKVDGNNRMGAGALAEHICEWLTNREGVKP